MKKITALVTTFAIVYSLSACNNPPSEPFSESMSESEISPVSSSDNRTENASDSGASAASTSETSTANVSKAPSTDIAVLSESGDDIPEDKPPEVPIPDDFDICDYITDFDDVELMGCSYVSETSIPLADEAAVEKALDAYFDSEAYSEALELAVEAYHFENGELTEYDDSEDWLKLGYKPYIVRSETSELTFQPDIALSAKYKFDGENEESIVMLKVPLPMSEIAWSNHADYGIPVYISSDGDAYILYDACYQGCDYFKLLSYADGSIQVQFDFGHNQAGQKSVIYSFKNGAPKLELSGAPIGLYDGILMKGFGWDIFEPFLYDKKNGEFCGVAAVSPSRELAEIICSDKTVLSYVPDAWESYKKDRIQVIGGKYITFVTGIPWSDNTFIYNSADKCFERVEQSVTAANSLPEQITKSYNVRL